MTQAAVRTVICDLTNCVSPGQDLRDSLGVMIRSRISFQISPLRGCFSNFCFRSSSSLTAPCFYRQANKIDDSYSTTLAQYSYIENAVNVDYDNNNKITFNYDKKAVNVVTSGWMSKICYGTLGSKDSLELFKNIGPILVYRKCRKRLL